MYGSNSFFASAIVTVRFLQVNGRRVSSHSLAARTTLTASRACCKLYFIEVSGMSRKPVYRVLAIAVCACILVTHSYGVLRAACCQPRNSSPVERMHCCTGHDSHGCAEFSASSILSGVFDVNEESEPLDTGCGDTCLFKIYQPVPLMTASCALNFLLPDSALLRELSEQGSSPGFSDSLFRPPRS